MTIRNVVALGVGLSLLAGISVAVAMDDVTMYEEDGKVTHFSYHPATDEVMLMRCKPWATPAECKSENDTVLFRYPVFKALMTTEADYAHEEAMAETKRIEGEVAYLAKHATEATYQAKLKELAEVNKRVSVHQAQYDVLDELLGWVKSEKAFVVSEKVTPNFMKRIRGARLWERAAVANAITAAQILTLAQAKENRRHAESLTGSFNGYVYRIGNCVLENTEYLSDRSGYVGFNKSFGGIVANDNYKLVKGELPASAANVLLRFRDYVIAGKCF